MPENKVNKAVVCPMCGELGKAEIYTSVNVTKNKEYREGVLGGGLFAWVCPSCGYQARLTYPILYNDMKNRFMVYLIPKIDRFQLCDKELEEKYSNIRHLNKRVVSDFNSFKEKIFIFESRLDDMAVELTKYAISEMVAKKLDLGRVSEGYLTMYNRETNTIGFTYFVGEEAEPFVQSARLEIYQKSMKIVEAICANDKKLSGFIKIDREWAENTLFRYKRVKSGR